MREFEIYALQVVDSLEQEYRSPEFGHRVALLAGLRNLGQKNSAVRK